MADRLSMPTLDAEGYLVDPADWTEAVAVEQRAQEIDGQLTVHAVTGRASLPPGTVAMTAKTCPTCSGAIPADANFCAYCGTPTA